MSLTTVGASARSGLKVGVVAVVLIPILFSMISGGIKLYKKAHPIKAEPNVKYGNIPKIEFPEKSIDPKNFTLELTSDQLPNLGNQARVYVVFRTDKNFLALETETQTAKQMGFDGEPQLVSPNLYQFVNSSNQKLLINILDGSFRLSYPYREDQMLMANASLPDKEQLVSKAKAFLSNAQKLPKDIDEGESKVSYWKNDGSGFKQVSSSSEANMARIDFYRASVNEDLKIVSSDVNRAPISVLISGSSSSGKDIVDVDYKYVNIDRNSFATYPIKTSAEALADLKNGTYWPVSDTSGKDVAIRKVSLAYFEPSTLTNFMQPVYVFEGDNSGKEKFAAYVPAVMTKFTR